MKKLLFLLTLFLLLTAYTPALTQDQIAAQRAMDLLTTYAEKNLALSRQEWQKQMGAEFFHPLRNDSGLFWFGPEHLPPVPEFQGDFITTSIQLLEIFPGTQPKLLKTDEPVYFVKIQITVLGGGKGGERLILFEKPRFQEVYVTMALDHQDGKWKGLDSRPLSAVYHYRTSVLAHWTEYTRQFKDYGDFDKIFEKLKALAKKP